ncbi:GPR1/FUN34/yaaH family-domain-containing protein [Xylogone sp. PMI_703]|nr:GPR1/FUN34/yaaH family-domain-containing protein [Xylogone sp. PMI_703]
MDWSAWPPQSQSEERVYCLCGIQTTGSNFCGGDHCANQLNNSVYQFAKSSNSFTAPESFQAFQPNYWFNTDLNNQSRYVANPPVGGGYVRTFERGDLDWGCASVASGESTLKEVPQVRNLSIPPELFGKLCVCAQSDDNKLSKKFGSPTPISNEQQFLPLFHTGMLTKSSALIGIIIALTPLSCDLMGWRGADSNGAAGFAYFFFGGVLTMLGGILEYFLGNTFPAAVFTSFGAFYFSWAATLMPFFNAYGFYTTSGSIAQPMHPDGWDTKAVGSVLTKVIQKGFFFLFMDILCVIYLICALRTNPVLVSVFFTLTIGLGLLVGEFFWKSVAYANKDQNALAVVNKLEIAAGAVLFVTCLAVWYEFLAIMLEIVEFPLRLPLGDLSKLMNSPADPEKIESAEKEPEKLETSVDCANEKTANLDEYATGWC